MNRFKQAWLVLRGTPAILRKLDGHPSIVSAYMHPDYPEMPRYYATCNQAHEAHPWGDIKKVQLIKIGDELYHFPRGYLWPINFEPKPKRPKGK